MGLDAGRLMKNPRMGERNGVIRELNEADRRATVVLLSRQPAMNLYLLGNLETLGFENSLCQFWGDFGQDGTLRAVLNRYMSGWALFGTPDADWAALAATLEQHPITAERLQDNPGGTASILPWLTRYQAVKVIEEELMQLDAAAFRPQPTPAAVRVRQAGVADLDALTDFYGDAGAMRRSVAAIKRPLHDTRVFVAEEADAIISVALTNAETANLAMIGGVYTPPGARGRGLSQAVCSALCQALLDDGKQPILYWETPAAGAVYRKLGFVSVGHWRSVWLAERE